MNSGTSQELAVPSGWLCSGDFSVPHLAPCGSNSSRARSFGDAPSPAHALPSSPSPLPPQSLVGTVTERLVGLQLGGRKERKGKKSQPEKRENDPFFSHLAPLAPGTAVLPSPAAWPHMDLLPLTPLECPWAVLTPWCITSHRAGSLQRPLGPPCFCPHPTGTCSELGQVSVVEGSGPLHTSDLTLPHWLPWGGPFSLWENL